jgi:hypothetical protein
MKPSMRHHIGSKSELIYALNGLSQPLQFQPSPIDQFGVFRMRIPAVPEC